MEERYESATIMITVGLGERRMRWKPICRVKFMKRGREMIKDLELDLDYGTSEQAERAGLVFSKKCVDAKPLKLAGLSLRKKILLAVVDPFDRKLNTCLHSLLNGAEL
jgi:hypothetical protein